MTTMNGHRHDAPAVTLAPFPPQQDDAPRGADEFRIAAGLASWSPAVLRASGLLREDEPAAVPADAARTAIDGDKVIRQLAAFVVLAVAAFAAVVSYSHIFDLGIHHGQSGTAARLLPLSVDGLIAAAALVMLHAARNRLPVPLLSRFMLALGVGATVAANVAYGLPFGWLSAVVSAWSAAAFVGSVEMAIRFVSDARSVATKSAPDDDDGSGDTDTDMDTDTSDDHDEGQSPPAPPAPPAPRRQRPSGSDKVRAILKRNPGLAKADVAELAGVSERTVERVKRELNGAAK